MIRLILRLFGITDFDTCKSCETLKQQLEFERSEKKQLTDTLLNILSPKVVEASPVELAPIVNSGGLFSRRRAALEAKDREEAKILKEAKFIGKADGIKDIKTNESVAKLEEEFGISEENQKNG